MKDIIIKLEQKREEAILKRRDSDENESRWLNGYLSAINEILRMFDPRCLIK